MMMREKILVIEVLQLFYYWVLCLLDRLVENGYDAYPSISVCLRLVLY